MSQGTYFVFCAAIEGFFLNDLFNVVVDRHQDRVGANGQHDEVPLRWKLDDEMAPVTKSDSNRIQHNLDVDVGCVFYKAGVLQPLQG